MTPLVKMPPSEDDDFYASLAGFALGHFRGRPLPTKIADFLFENWCEFCGAPETGDARHRCQCWNDE